MDMVGTPTAVRGSQFGLLNALLLGVAVLLSSAGIGQPKLEAILNTALDLKPLYEHIDSNEVIVPDSIRYMKYDKRIPSTVKLRFKGHHLESNDGSTSSLFFHWYSIAIDTISVRGSKAVVGYSYFPEWVHCSDGIQTTRSGQLYMHVLVSLTKQRGTWLVSTVEVRDVKFDGDTPECIKLKYVPFQNPGSWSR